MNLDDLIQRETFRQTSPAWCRIVWPRPESLVSFIKMNRPRLIDEKAIIKLGREIFILKNNFMRVAIDILSKETTNTIENIESHRNK